MNQLNIFFVSAVLSLVSYASLAAPRSQDLDKAAGAFIQTQISKPDGLFALDFLKTARRAQYYSVDKYHDYDSGQIKTVIIGIFTAIDKGSKFNFGIIFDENGKAEKLLTLTANAEEKCIPFIISDEKIYKVYYTAKDRTSGESLLIARARVISSMFKTLEKNNLLSGSEQVVFNLKPNDSQYERQDHITIRNGLRLRQEQIIKAFVNINVADVGELIISVERSGNPVQDPFNQQSNAVCTLLK